MPQISGRGAIAAGPAINVLAGQLFERIGARPARIKVYACNDDAAAALGDLTATMYVGSEVLVQNAPLPRSPALGLAVPDHQIANGVALPGDQLILEITSAAAGDTAQWLVDISPI